MTQRCECPSALVYVPFTLDPPGKMIVATQVMLALCVVQALLVLLLSLNVRPALRIVEDLSTSSELLCVVWTTLAAVFAYFGFGVVSLTTAPPLDHAAPFLIVDLLRTQRDTLLAAFVLFASLLIRIAGKQSKAFTVLELKFGAMKRQAQGAAKAFDVLLDERKLLESLLGDKAPEATTEQIVERLKTADDRSRQLEQQLATAKADFEAMRAQAQNAADQHLKSLDDNKSLQRKLEDYEFMFGGKKKKVI